MTPKIIHSASLLVRQGSAPPLLAAQVRNAKKPVFCLIRRSRVQLRTQKRGSTTATRERANEEAKRKVELRASVQELDSKSECNGSNLLQDIKQIWKYEHLDEVCGPDRSSKEVWTR